MGLRDTFSMGSISVPFGAGAHIVQKKYHPWRRRETLPELAGDPKTMSEAAWSPTKWREVGPGFSQRVELEAKEICRCDNIFTSEVTVSANTLDWLDRRQVE